MIFNLNLKQRDFNSAWKNQLNDLKDSWSNIKFGLHDLVNFDLHIGSKYNMSALGNSWSWSYIIKKNVIFNLKYIYYNLKFFLKNLYERSTVYSDIVYANFNKAFVNFIEKWALKTGVMYILGTWFRGGLTNFKNFYKFIQICRNDLKRFKSFGRYYSGIFKLTKMPDFLILTSNKDNFSRVLLNEAINYTTIDLIVLNDSLVDSRGCNFIIPGNEKSMNSLNFLYDLFHKEIQRGRFIYLCEKYKELIKNKKKEEYKYLKGNKESRLNLNKEQVQLFKRKFFNNEKYFNKFFVWFNFMNRRIREKNQSKKLLHWWSRFYRGRIRKRRTHFRDNFIRTKMKSLKWLRFVFLLRKRELRKRKISILRRGVSYDIPSKLFSKRNKGKRKKSSIKNIYFRPLNFTRRILKDRSRVVPFNSNLHDYYQYKSENFNKFFIKLRKSSSLISLFEKEVNNELGVKFNKDEKLNNLNNLWDFFDGRKMNNWWKLQRGLYENGNQNHIRKDFVNKEDFEKKWYFKSPISTIINSEAIRLRKVSKSKLKHENKRKILEKNLNYAINSIRLYKECFPNNNYFKNKKKITVVYYRSLKET